MAIPLPSPFDLDQRPVAIIFRSPVFNGSETFIAAQAGALRRYQPLVVGLERRPGLPDALAERRLMASAGEGLKLKLIGVAAGLAKRLRPYRPALIHAHFGPDGLIALPLAKALDIPLVTTLHGYEVNRSRSRLLTSGRLSWMRHAIGERHLQRECDLFLAVSDALRRRALERHYPAERMLTHRIGVELGRFPPGEGGGTTLLHVGRLVEKKGTHILLRAFAELAARTPGVTLAIIGDGPRRPALERLAGELGLGDAVRFLGALPQQAVAEWMRASALLVVPSVTAADGDAEGLPVVIFEAAASGLPVVGSDHAGISEAVIDGRTGCIVPEGDAGALAACLRDLLEAPEHLAGMRGEARALAERSFDLERQTAELERLYDRIGERKLRT